MTILLTQPALPAVHEDQIRPERTRHSLLSVLLAAAALLIGLATMWVIQPGSRDAASGTHGISWQVLAISKITGLPPAAVQVSGGHTIATATGDRYDMDVAGIGIVQANPATHEITEIVYANRLTGGPASVPAAAAAATARAYAQPRFDGFGQLSSRATTRIDHGSWVEYRVVWQQRLDAAWTPTQVAVGVNAASGQIAYYWTDRVAVTVPITPRITAAAAATAALHAVGITGRAVAGTPELQVVTLSASQQQLVWSVSVRSPRVRGLQIASDVIVHVDARTGNATVWGTD
jgi:hypothetical protein